VNSKIANQKIDIDDQGTANEHHKQDQLKKQKEGKGHWKPELASNSEEAVCFLIISPIFFLMYHCVDTDARFNV
jgi:hypothetical protein